MDEPVKTAVILTAHGRGLTDDLSGQNRADLFRFAELFAFAALAAREFFSADYFNRDHLRLVVQAFTDPQGGASMEMRRRDGVQWSSVTGDYYRVQVPAHVSPGGQLIKPDLALFNALLESRERLESLAWSGLHRGIVLFNQANTDAPDMSPDTELVLTCSAIEQVLGITSPRVGTRDSSPRNSPKRGIRIEKCHRANGKSRPRTGPGRKTPYGPVGLRT